MTFENIGTIATSAILLFGGPSRVWKEWDALETSEKFLRSKELFQSIYDIGHKKVDEKTLEQNAQDFINIMNEYHKIMEANGEKE